MAESNISDVIEQYLKQILDTNEIVEIKRSEIANQFEVVPSQINYVISTRFNLQNGYVVESKRGGGGYIRIGKVDLLDNVQIFDEIIDMIGDSISQRNALAILQSLADDDVITEREANMMVSATEKDTLRIVDKATENTIRARVLIGMLNRLRLNN